ncbi:unnamed protein product [Brachionus calyciflorus]|uniref:Uncharacterized protein n=1 Tax=Brachionus calyciflorus TaxID=104777 RepID=A0A814JAU8_9BILA|nr:unnamed protein product [Brachionus calyciflorus]
MSESPISDKSQKGIYMTRIDLKKSDNSFDSLNEELSEQLPFKNKRIHIDPDVLNEKIKHCVIRRSSMNRKSNQYLVRNSKTFEAEQDRIMESSDSSDSDSTLASYNLKKQSKHSKKSKSSLSSSKSFDFDKLDIQSEDTNSKKSVTFIINNQEPEEEQEDTEIHPLPPLPTEEVPAVIEPKKSTSSWSKIKCTSLSEIKRENNLDSKSSKSLVSLLQIESPVEEPVDLIPPPSETELLELEKAHDEKQDNSNNKIDDEEQELLESLGELNKISTLKLNELANNRYLDEKKRNEINNLIKNKNCFLRRVSSFPTRSLSKRTNANPLYDVKSKIEQFEKIKSDQSASTNFFVRGKYSRNSPQMATSHRSGALMKTKISSQIDAKDANTLTKQKNKISDLDEICSFINVKGLKSIFESNNNNVQK